MPRTRQPPIDVSDVVVLVRDVPVSGGTAAKGSTGTVATLLYPPGTYAVRIDPPLACTATVGRDDIRPAMPEEIAARAASRPGRGNYG